MSESSTIDKQEPNIEIHPTDDRTHPTDEMALQNEECCFTNKYGVKCTSKIIKGSYPKKSNLKDIVKYPTCYRHRHMNIESFPQNECSVCLENGTLFTLQCNHAFHLSCLEKMVDSVCPLCRREMIGLPKQIISKIRKNKREYQEEFDIGYDVHEIELPNFELISALHRLQNDGIPEQYYDVEMYVAMDDTYEYGTIFNLIMAHVYANVRHGYNVVVNAQNEVHPTQIFE